MPQLDPQLFYVSGVEFEELAVAVAEFVQERRTKKMERWNPHSWHAIFHVYDVFSEYHKSPKGSKRK